MALKCVICEKTFEHVDKLVTSDPKEPVTAVMCFPCSFRRLGQGLVPPGEDREFLEKLRLEILELGPEDARAWGIEVA